MSVLVHHLLLAVAVAALLASGLRAASALVPDGLARVLAAVVFAAAAAVVEAMALGLAALGGDALVLTAAAIATWLASRLLPRPARPLSDELLDRWAALGMGGRVAAGALIGAALAWTWWLLRYPAFGWDALIYHIPESVSWVHSGRPGSVVDVLPSWPVGAYPLVNEVLIAWSAAVSRGFAALTVWPGALVGLLAGAAWLGLRELSVPRLPAALATGSICFAPLLTSFHQYGPGTDLPALAWLICAAAFCAAYLRRNEPALLVPAVVAAGLSIGTKTTTLPIAALLLAFFLFKARAQLRAVGRPLGAAALVALVVGGFWYLRNLVDHGSPFWPFVTTPWGDPKPATVALLDGTFLQHPSRTLAHFNDPGYVWRTFVGGVLILGAAFLAPLAARRRAVTACALVALLSLLLWLNSPATGITHLPGSWGATHSTLRYLLPGLTAATLTVALVARRSDWLGRAATAVLGAALAINAVQMFQLDFPHVPAVTTPLIGGLLGAAGAAAALPRLIPVRALWRPLAAGCLGIGVAAALAAGSTGLVERHGKIAFDGRIVRWLHGLANDRRTIWMTPVMDGLLTGDRLDRRVEALQPNVSCETVKQRASRGLVAVSAFGLEGPFGPGRVDDCVAPWSPEYEDTQFHVYGRHSASRPRSRGHR